MDRVTMGPDGTFTSSADCNNCDAQVLEDVVNPAIRGKSCCCPENGEQCYPASGTYAKTPCGQRDYSWWGPPTGGGGGSFLISDAPVPDDPGGGGLNWIYFGAGGAGCCRHCTTIVWGSGNTSTNCVTRCGPEYC